MKLLRKKNVLFFICFEGIDVLFHLIAFKTLPGIRSFLFAGIFTLIENFISSRFHYKTAFFIDVVVLCIAGIYAYIEIEFLNFFETFYSFKVASSELDKLSDYIFYFVGSSELIYFFLMGFGILYMILFHFFENDTKYRYRHLILLVLLVSGFVGSIYFDDDVYKDAFFGHENFNLLIEKDGINFFLYEDVASIFIDNNTEIVVEPEQEIVVEEEPKKISYVRSFDDSEWMEVASNETNTNLKTIDEYLMSRTIDSKNEYTGLFKDYNFVWFLAESFDYMAIDPVLTPTLYKMMNDGFFFTNHYTPIYSCGTGDSEFVSMTSMMTQYSYCAPNSSSLHNTLNNSIAGLFKNAGYDTYSFHNYDDTFYNRHELNKAYGVDEYYDLYDLKMKIVTGWQSDSDLVVKALEKMKDSDRFFGFIVSSTMHWPYDSDSYYGNLNIDRINEVHPEYPMDVKRYLSKSMEFDKAMEVLLEGLTKQGKLNNTVISFWPDHHPFKFDASVIREYSFLKDRSDNRFALDRSPFVIYCPSIKGKPIDNVCSTLDHLPTVANLFDLNYDPRIYCGKDIFNGNCIVMFKDGNWINDQGYYRNGEFTKLTDNVFNDNSVQIVTKNVKNTMKIFRAMLDTDYFKYRQFVISPKNKE